MQRLRNVLAVSLILFLIVLLTKNLLAGQEGIRNLSKAKIIQKTQRLQMPFIANQGQADEQVKFYANTFGGSVFVTKCGEIVYALPVKNSELKVPCRGEPLCSPVSCVDNVRICRPQGIGTTFGCAYCSAGAYPPSFECPLNHFYRNILLPQTQPTDKASVKTQDFVVSSVERFASLQEQNQTMGIALKEEFVDGKTDEIKGESQAVTNVSYFKGNDPSKWKTNISTYDVVSLGEVYNGIELKLKAYGNNVEKLFYVKPDASTDQIQIMLNGASSLEKGARGLSINEHGELEVETELGSVKFTKPVAYQAIDGERVEVDCEYVIRDREPPSVKDSKNTDTYNGHGQRLIYGFKVASYDKTRELIIDPILASTYLGGSGVDSAYPIAIDIGGNIYIAGTTASSDFPTIPGAYDTSYKSGSDVFISRLNSGLTSLLASTYLGGSNSDWTYRMAIDTSGNIYVVGGTSSSDFPVTPGAYDTSYHVGGYLGSDAFVSKLNSGL